MGVGVNIATNLCVVHQQCAEGVNVAISVCVETPTICALRAGGNIFTLALRPKPYRHSEVLTGVDFR